MAENVVSRGFTEVHFEDQYGERRTIHRGHGQALRLKKREDSVSHLLNRAAGKMMGARIKAMRIERGMTLDQLLIRAGLTAAPGQAKNRMYEIENAGGNSRAKKNGQGIRFGTLYAIAIALECPVTALMPTAEDVAREAGVAIGVATEQLQLVHR